ncbi:MAG: carbohydrate kinase family protein [Candidatus Dependentiae bacterium]
MKIITIGGATTDIFIQTKHTSELNFATSYEQRSFLLFEEGSKIDANTLHFHTGGGATNSAVSFKKLDFDVTTFFKVGDDKPSEFIMQRLADIGINTQYIKQSDEYITGHSFIFPSKSGDRTVLSYRGANAHLHESEIPQVIKQFGNVYITSLSGDSAHMLLPITRLAKMHSGLVATNPGTSQLTSGTQTMYESLPNIDIFILNSDEACSFMLSMIEQDIELHQKILNTKVTQRDETLPELLQAPISYQTVYFDIRLFFEQVLSRGPKIVVVTNGAEGVYVATQDGIIFHPSLPTKIVNTLGAGDAFGSCFVAKYIEGANIKEAMLYGIINASSVISHLDAKSGLLTNHELEKRFEHVDKDSFQEFDLNV